ncbi:MAG TPA: prepilin-type N-terminal cleavage/methylation domain-containing protein [Gemmatimonadaceae bacterium]|nr:prepilin-type N-terminal cleavage/methylation domain-containing protein [Gemmatimonadaceae bacterium]
MKHKLFGRLARRSRAETQPQRGRSRRGIGLVEVLAAMVILAVTLTSLAPLVYSVSRSTLTVTGRVYRNGVLMQEVNRLVALPYDNLTVGTTSVTVSSNPYPHTRTITITEPVANLKTVKVKIVPLSSAFAADSVTFKRTKARTSKYLCTTCQ